MNLPQSLGPQIVAAAAMLWTATAAAAAAPEIFSLEPDQASAGDEITIKGRNLKGPREVLFCTGYTLKQAKFKPVSDQELKVVVPDYFLPDVPAVVALVTAHGTTVCMPPTVVEVDGSQTQYPSGAPFYHVQKGGIVQSAGGVTVIESGGVVSSASHTGVVFVKSGGTLVRYRNPAGIVLYEPGAILGEKFGGGDRNAEERQVRQIQVPAITTSLGIEPFLFQAPKQAPGKAQQAPRVNSILPRVAGPSEVIQLRGRGFLETSEVYFSNGLMGRTEFQKVGFQVVSDRQLRVVVPDVMAPPNWEFMIVVVNPLGATVTVPPTSHNVRSLSQAAGRGQAFYWMDASELRKSSGGNFLFIDRDVTETKTAGLTFIKNGGQLATTGGGAIFYEPDAVLPEIVKKRNREAYAVPEVSLSVVSEMFTTPPRR